MTGLCLTNCPQAYANWHKCSQETRRFGRTPHRVSILLISNIRGGPVEPFPTESLGLSTRCSIGSYTLMMCASSTCTASQGLPPLNSSQRYLGLPPKRSSFRSGSLINHLRVRSLHAVTLASFICHELASVFNPPLRSQDNTLKKNTVRVMWF